MIPFRSIRTRTFAAVVLAVSTIGAVPAAAAPEGPNQCVFTVTGTDEEGNFTGDLVCFTTFEEALKKAGSKNVPAGATPSTIDAPAVLSGTSIVGIHYDASNGTGNSLTVNGTTCSGGGNNVPTPWNDVISSTVNGCPTIVHYEHANYGGVTYTTYGAGSLSTISGYMNNRTTSIKYFS